MPGVQILSTCRGSKLRKHGKKDYFKEEKQVSAG